MPTTKGSRKDSHLTILGFMAASGQPLMCAIIFSAAKMKDEWWLTLFHLLLWKWQHNRLITNANTQSNWWVAHFWLLHRTQPLSVTGWPQQPLWSRFPQVHPHSRRQVGCRYWTAIWHTLLASQGFTSTSHLRFKFVLQAKNQQRERKFVSDNSRNGMSWMF